MSCVLVVEDKASLGQMLVHTLEGEGYRVELALSGEEAIQRLEQLPVDLVLTDLRLPGRDGLAVLKAARERDPTIPVILMTAYGSIETAVQAMKAGAYDFLTKPLDMDYLPMLIQRALEARRLSAENLLLREAAADRLGVPTIVGKSSKIQAVSRQIQQVAKTNATVLLLGESGTGKELFARALHHLSDRSRGPFVAINCAAIPRELLESELFGHERGAFTGAVARKRGKFELAHRGTLFLDEVGELELGLQAKLLRVLQEHEIQRVGGTGSVPVDVRVVAATNQDLEKAVQTGRFREDLFYRLNVFPVRIPPLRERREDIPALVEFFLHRFCKDLKKPPLTVAPDAMDRLRLHPWKGNVRELENCLERAVILCEGPVIQVEHLGLPSQESPAVIQEPFPEDATLREVAASAVRQAEMQYIRHVLQQTRGNKSQAARRLGVSYKTLLTKIKEYGLD